MRVKASRYNKIVQVLRKRQPDLAVVAQDVHKPHNLSAILRSCDAVGVGRVYATNPTGGVPTFNETSASADKWVQLEVHESSAELIGTLRGQGLQVLAAHLSDVAVDYREPDYKRHTALLVGNETWGVSEEAASLATSHIIIPMLGMVQSLNVSVAAAAILFEAQRQRLNAGFYDEPRLSEREINDQAFRWLYPREASVFEANRLDFPWLDTNGTWEPDSVH